ncbi:hypothetical protein J2Z69_003647 [Paenibacillus shirakamiensis]|uniref:Uncharacterized protein n=1 Tax=Paenibacillus shirakamiensis TaxID=1265935 RepID=A0ABS4JN37_9BACL|nr:hypothetical protein [Paenibacillus shirakamiensis]MBP2002561.1 hypothetical protein [Paenibacillus shirakamiensis]
MYSAKDMLSRLADVFTKEPNSNLGRLIRIVHEQLEQVEVGLDTVRQWRSIHTAQGVTLDNIGQNVAQPRGAATDEIYRVLIQSKIARNLSKTDINTIIQVLALALNCDMQDIRIDEKYSDSAAPEPAAISLIRVPIKRLNEVGMSPMQFGQIIQRTVAAGVRVAMVELAGTFQLSSQDSGLEAGVTGLSDIAMNKGGSLGEVYVPGYDYGLPL